MCEKACSTRHVDVWEKERSCAFSTTKKRDGCVIIVITELTVKNCSAQALGADGDMTETKKKEATHKVPQCAERRNTGFLATLHNLRVATVVRRDENDCVEKQNECQSTGTPKVPEMQVDRETDLRRPKSDMLLSLFSLCLVCRHEASNPIAEGVRAQYDGGSGR